MANTIKQGKLSKLERMGTRMQSSNSGGAKRNLPSDVVTVPHPDDMDDETFLLHMDKRHRGDTKVDGKLVLFPNRVTAWVKLYRTYHERLHEIAIPGQYDHQHLKPSWME